MSEDTLTSDVVANDRDKALLQVQIANWLTQWAADGDGDCYVTRTRHGYEVMLRGDKRGCVVGQGATVTESVADAVVKWDETYGGK